MSAKWVCVRGDGYIGWSWLGRSFLTSRYACDTKDAADKLLRNEISDPSIFSVQQITRAACQAFRNYKGQMGNDGVFTDGRYCVC